MLAHYSDLFRRFWRRILAVALLTGALACALSIALLNTMPRYASAVTLNMQPSEEALRFNSAFLGVSQFNPANIITQAHIERLLSRPVAERALDILIAEAGGDLAAEPPDAFDRLKLALRRNWALLNYGYFAPVGEREKALAELMAATDVEVVTGSYILKLEITHEDPALAAHAANALARAYVETASEDFAGEAAAVDAALAALQAEKQAELARRMNRRRDLDRALGFESIADGRAILLARRTEARNAAMVSAGRVETLRDRLDRAGQAAEAADVRELREAEAMAALDDEALAEAEVGLQALDRAEIRRAEIDQRIRETERDMAELQGRRIMTELARKARLNHVRIIDKAAPPPYPSFPKVLVNTVIALILGGVLAAAPIAAMDVLDDRIRTAEDLRQAVGARALPTLSAAMASRARRFLRNGRNPGRALSAYAEAMGRRFMTDGRSRWPERPVYVSAFGSPDDIDDLRAAVDAALRLRAARGGPAAATPEVVALPAIAQLSDWSLYRDGILVIGVPFGGADSAEVKRVVDAASEAAAVCFLTVLA